MRLPAVWRQARSWFRYGAQVAACAATFFALGSVAGRASALPLAGFDDPLGGTPTLQVTKPVGSPAVVTWRARVKVDGGRFLVYRGSDARHLLQVAELAADRGERVYHFRDGGSVASEAVYEVRFATRAGSEQLLARAHCGRTAGLGSGATPETPRQPHAVLAATGQEPSCAGPLTSPAFASASTQASPQPPVPPPRQLAA